MLLVYVKADSCLQRVSNEFKTVVSVPNLNSARQLGVP